MEQRHQKWNSEDIHVNLWSRQSTREEHDSVSYQKKERTPNTILINHRETFAQDSLILHPNSFPPTATTATWLRTEECLWCWQIALLEKTPLVSPTSRTYSSDRKLERLFCEVLGIANVNWKDYVGMLKKLERDGETSPHLPNLVTGLYKQLSQANLGTEDNESLM